VSPVKYEQGFISQKTTFFILPSLSVWKLKLEGHETGFVCGGRGEAVTCRNRGRSSEVMSACPAARIIQSTASLIDVTAMPLAP
jgi:hypothetical protein